MRVNGQTIPDEAIQFELERLVRFYAQHMPEDRVREQMPLLKQKAIDQAIGSKLLIDEARRLDFTVLDEEVDARVREIVEQCGGQDAFEQMLTSQKMTEEMVRAGIDQGRRVDQLVAKISEGLSDPTEEAMREHFESHAEEYANPPRVQAQHILVKAGPDDEKEGEAAEARILAIRKRIDEGADFADEAAAHSDCPSGKKTGGGLGWFSRGMMVPEFDEVVFSMAVGELSDPVKTQFGCHLIKKTAEDEGDEVEFEDVRDKVRDFLRHVARGETIAKYVEELKAKATIEQD